MLNKKIRKITNGVAAEISAVICKDRLNKLHYAITVEEYDVVVTLYIMNFVIRYKNKNYKKIIKKLSKWLISVLKYDKDNVFKHNPILLDVCYRAYSLYLTRTCEYSSIDYSAIRRAECI